MLVTLFGIVRLVNPVQSWNENVPMVVMPSFNVTLVNIEQSSNAPYPKTVSSVTCTVLNEDGM